MNIFFRKKINSCGHLFFEKQFFLLSKIFHKTQLPKTKVSKALQLPIIENFSILKCPYLGKLFYSSIYFPSSSQSQLQDNPIQSSCILSTNNLTILNHLFLKPFLVSFQNNFKIKFNYKNPKSFFVLSQHYLKQAFLATTTGRVL